MKTNNKLHRPHFLKLFIQEEWTTMTEVKKKEMKKLLAYNCISPSTTGYHSLSMSQKIPIKYGN
jgi:hypothetical protein